MENGEEVTSILNTTKKRFYKETRLYWSTWSDKDKKLYYCHYFSRINSETRTCFMEHQHRTEQRSRWLLCLSPFHTLLYLLNFFVLAFFLLHWSLHVIIRMSALIEIFTLYFFVECLNVCNYRLVRQLIHTDHINAYNMLFYMGMIWYKKITSPIPI